MRYVVYGAGAVGGVVGGRLALTGHGTDSPQDRGRTDIHTDIHTEEVA